MHLIMFDIDGTLVNSSKFDEETYIQTAKDLLGVDIPTDINEYPHATDAGILDEIISRFKIQGDRKDIIKGFRAEFNRRISDYIDNNAGRVHEIAGASGFIRHLQTFKNVKICLATGCWEETARLKLDAAGIDITGLAVASSSDHYIRTEIMKLAESKTGYRKTFESKTYFGDAAWDLEASQKLGCRFVLVGNRIEHKTSINDYQDIDRIMDIIDI